MGLQDIDDKVHDVLRDAMTDENFKRHFRDLKQFITKAAVAFLHSNSSRMKPEHWENLKKELNGIGFEEI